MWLKFHLFISTYISKNLAPVYNSNINKIMNDCLKNIFPGILKNAERSQYHTKEERGNKINERPNNLISYLFWTLTAYQLYGADYKFPKFLTGVRKELRSNLQPKG